MKAILDTHAFIWWITDDNQMSPGARKVIEDEDNEIFVSAASIWEIVIKAKLGKITLPKRADIFLAEQIALNDFSSLPMLNSHALKIFSLPDIHRDPFDRMLVAQAQTEDCPIITSDSVIGKYSVSCVW